MCHNWFMTRWDVSNQLSLNPDMPWAKCPSDTFIHNHQIQVECEHKTFDVVDIKAFKTLLRLSPLGAKSAITNEPAGDNETLLQTQVIGSTLKRVLLWRRLPVPRFSTTFFGDKLTPTHTMTSRWLARETLWNNARHYSLSDHLCPTWVRLVSKVHVSDACEDARSPPGSIFAPWVCTIFSEGVKG